MALKNTLEWWEDQLAEYEELMQLAASAESWTATANLGRRCETARAMVDELRADIASGPEDMTEEELIHEYGKSARGMPDAHLEVFVDEYARRHNVPKLKLVENKG